VSGVVWNLKAERKIEKGIVLDSDSKSLIVQQSIFGLSASDRHCRASSNQMGQSTRSTVFWHKRGSIARR